MNLMDTRSGALRIVSKFKAPNRNKNAASTQKTQLRLHIAT